MWPVVLIEDSLNKMFDTTYLGSLSIVKCVNYNVIIAGLAFFVMCPLYWIIQIYYFANKVRLIGAQTFKLLEV